MNDYSDLFLVIGSMILYSVLMVDINATILQGQQYTNDREAEYTAISLAQDVVDEARWTPFTQFNTTYANYADTHRTSLGDYLITTKTTDNVFSSIGVGNNHKRLDVKVESLFTTDTVSVVLSYVKNE